MKNSLSISSNQRNDSLRKFFNKTGILKKERSALREDKLTQHDHKSENHS